MNKKHFFCSVFLIPVLIAANLLTGTRLVFADPAEPYAYICSSSAWVYTAADDTSEVIGAPQRFEQIPCEGEYTDDKGMRWILTTYNGRSGYIPRDDCERSADEIFLMPYSAVILRDAYVYTGPGSSYRNMGLLHRGSTVTYFQSMNGWLEIDYNGQLGWLAQPNTALFEVGAGIGAAGGTTGQAGNSSSSGQTGNNSPSGQTGEGGQQAGADSGALFASGSVYSFPTGTYVYRTPSTGNTWGVVKADKQDFLSQGISGDGRFLMVNYYGETGFIPLEAGSSTGTYDRVRQNLTPDIDMEKNGGQRWYYTTQDAPCYNAGSLDTAGVLPQGSRIRANAYTNSAGRKQFVLHDNSADGQSGTPNVYEISAETLRPAPVFEADHSIWFTDGSGSALPESLEFLPGSSLSLSVAAQVNGGYDPGSCTLTWQCAGADPVAVPLSESGTGRLSAQLSLTPKENWDGASLYLVFRTPYASAVHSVILKRRRTTLQEVNVELQGSITAWSAGAYGLSSAGSADAKFRSRTAGAEVMPEQYLEPITGSSGEVLAGAHLQYFMLHAQAGYTLSSLSTESVWLSGTNSSKARILSVNTSSTGDYASVCVLVTEPQSSMRIKNQISGRWAQSGSGYELSFSAAATDAEKAVWYAIMPDEGWAMPLSAGTVVSWAAEMPAEETGEEGEGDEPSGETQTAKFEVRYAALSADVAALKYYSEKNTPAFPGMIICVFTGKRDAVKITEPVYVPTRAGGKAAAASVSDKEIAMAILANLGIAEHDPSVTAEQIQGAHRHAFTTLSSDSSCTGRHTIRAICPQDSVSVSFTGEGCSHAAGAWNVTAGASCLGEGSMSRSCPVCGANETVRIPAAGHTDMNADFFCDVCGQFIGSETDTGERPPASADSRRYYTIISGADSEWWSGSTEGLAFAADAPQERLTRVLVDGAQLDTSRFSVETYGTGTSAVLKPEYLKSLPYAGRHRIMLVFSDGEASADFSAPVDVSYTCTQGDGTEWASGSGVQPQFVITRTPDNEAALDHFRNITADGETVSSASYSVSGDPLTLELKIAFLSGLTDGVHTLRVNFDDGFADIHFTVSLASSETREITPEVTKPEEPEQQDNFLITLMLILAAAAIAVLIAFIILRLVHQVRRQ